jgi:hypothetical protein
VAYSDFRCTIRVISENSQSLHRLLSQDSRQMAYKITKTSLPIYSPKFLIPPIRTNWGWWENIATFRKRGNVCLNVVHMYYPIERREVAIGAGHFITPCGRVYFGERSTRIQTSRCVHTFSCTWLRLGWAVSNLSQSRRCIPLYGTANSYCQLEEFDRSPYPTGNTRLRLKNW